MNILHRVNNFAALKNVFEKPLPANEPGASILVVEGVRGVGKTTLIEKLRSYLECPVYSTFQHSAGGRKGIDRFGAQIDPATSAFVAHDAISQVAKESEVGWKAIIDRGYISTMVFNGWTHGRLTLARKQWMVDCPTWHIWVRACTRYMVGISSAREDCGTNDLIREEQLFGQAFKEAYVPVIIYDNLELCGHKPGPHENCRSLRGI